ncbi:uncharacterized protein LOC132265005 [Phlebotomus argentipes]|uniref:uncharacterized protein LOC132265005 n=1 Tax=Phlebotomus argentipes TaxID=94469 RepID=UPI00289321C2|nr:uncharacterized protein LOC132265005 [Phlebotomus argentipes]
MNTLVCALIFLLFFIGFCQAENPEKYCIRTLKDTHFDCIVYCKYNYYVFTDGKFSIDKKHMDNLTYILIKYKAVDSSKKKQVQEHLEKCKEKAIRKNKTPSCDRIMDYYRCVVDDKLIDFDKYDRAMRMYDSTIIV